MPSVQSSLDFLARLALYETEKPYILLPLKGQGLDPDEERLDNLEFETHDGIVMKDIRENSRIKVDSYGFEYYRHTTSVHGFDTTEDVDAYQVETEQLLRERFSALYVLTYDVRLRRNERFDRREVDYLDKLLVEGPAKGAHVGECLLKHFVQRLAHLPDVTFTSGPQIIQRYLPKDKQIEFLRQGFRIRIFKLVCLLICPSFSDWPASTWRPLNDVLEDRPLAICDSRTVHPEELIPADRILPDRIGEVYYLQYAPHQQWQVSDTFFNRKTNQIRYWLEKQTKSEPFIFLMYDTQHRKDTARCESLIYSTACECH
jgi:hypothetical protein